MGPPFGRDWVLRFVFKNEAEEGPNGKAKQGIFFSFGMWCERNVCISFPLRCRPTCFALGEGNYALENYRLPISAVVLSPSSSFC